MLNADSPEVTRFLAAWHENGRAPFDRRNLSKLDYDEYYPKTAKARTKYLALDAGGAYNRSGVFLVDRATGEVYTIRGYGVPNRRVGEISALTAAFERATATGASLVEELGYVAGDARLARAAKEAAT